MPKIPALKRTNSSEIQRYQRGVMVVSVRGGTGNFRFVRNFAADFGV